MTSSQAQAENLKLLLDRLGYACAVYHGRLLTWPPRCELPDEVEQSVKDFQAELIGMTKALVITKWVPTPKLKGGK